MMDERKLNIDAPLMSVRRSCGTSPSLTEAKRKILDKPQDLPHYKSDTTLDQVTEPVAVPFNWEHIPGRPKGCDGSEPQPPTQASITPTPTLPPGKSTIVARQPLEKDPNVPNKFRSSSMSNTLSEFVNKLDCDCDSEKKDEKIKEAEQNDDYDEDGDVYSDALETLSPTEPLSMNCSVSGMSGLDNLDGNVCETSSTDKQAHDFMMSRFLTAAEAMTIQPPQYASSRKQPPLAEQTREFIKLVPEQKKSFVNRHITDIVPYTGQYEEEEDEEEESDDETNDYANNSAKGCGLFPRFRVRNSLCLLNPVPGAKMGNQFSLFSAYEVGKPDKSSRIRSHRPAPAIKKAWDAINKSKLTSSSRATSPDTRVVSKKWTSESSRYTYSGELKQIGRLSPFRRSRTAAAGISPCQTKPRPLFPGARLLGDSKQADNHSEKCKFPSRGHASFQEVLSQGARKSSSSRSLTIEKTLYIDNASTVKLSCSSSRSLGNTTAVGTDRNSIVDSFQDMKHRQALEKNLDSQVLNSGDANSSTLSSMLHLMAEEDKAERTIADQETKQESMSLQLVPSSLDEDAKINNQQIVVVDDNSGKVGAEYVLHPLAPPLPKSPSESWLCRALPLVFSKNSFPHSNQGTQSQAKRQGFSRASSYTKWETIVKSSNLNHDHVNCSKELVVYKSQHSKS